MTDTDKAPIPAPVPRRQESDGDPGGWSLATLEKVDRICLRFEQAWKGDEAPALEELLHEAADAAERALLLEELLPIELEYRFPHGDWPLEAYRQRFASYASVLEVVRERLETRRQRPLPTARRWLGHFELLEVLGRGGMGVVYKAGQWQGDRLLRTVAVKVIRPDRFGEAAEQRFLQEVLHTAKLEHPHIPRVYEAGKIEGQLFFSMEFVAGRSLHQLLQDAPLESREAARIAAKVGDALNYAHVEFRTLHRDVKPRNILLDQRGEPRLVDFGLARRQHDASGITESGELVGTASYMSPEQSSGNRELGPETDVYGLGATLYAMLTGHPPFQADSVVETLRQVQERQPPSLRQWNPQIPQDLETICLGCLEKEPQRRYRNAGEVAEELRRFLEGRPILRRRITPVGRLWRWARRRPLAAAGTTALVATLLTAAIGGPAVALHVARLNQELIQSERQALEHEAKAEAERNRSEKNLQMALRAIEGMQTRMASEVLRHAPQMSLLRDEIYEEALALFDELQQQEGDDPRLLNLVARASFEAGQLKNLLGRFEEALRSYDKSAASYETLLRNNAENSDLRVNLAFALNGEAICLQHLEDFSQAEGRYRRALELLEPRSAESDQAQRMLRRKAATITANLAALLHERGKTEDSLAVYRNAFWLYEQGFASVEPTLQQMLVRARSRIGYCGVLSDAGRFSEAEEQARQSLEELSLAPAELEQDPGLRRARALAYSNLSRAVQLQGRLEDAALILQDAITLFGELAADFPAIAAFVQDYSSSMFNMATLSRSMNRDQETATWLEDGLKQIRKAAALSGGAAEHLSLLAKSMDNLALARHRLGRSDAYELHREALEIFRSLVDRHPETPVHLDGLVNSLLLELPLAESREQREMTLTAFHEALDMLQRLAENNPTMLRYQDVLAEAHAGRCRVYLDRGEAQHAIQDAARSVEIRRRIVAEFPDDVQQAMQLAGSLGDLSGLAGTLGDDHSAARLNQESLRILRELADRSPTRADVQRSLITCLLNSALVQFQDADGSARLATLQEGLDICRGLLAMSPDQQECLSQLRAIQNTRSIVLLTVGRLGEAQEAAEESVQVARRLTDAFPEDAELQRDLGGSLNTLAHVRLREGKSASAIPLLEEAIQRQLQDLAVQPRNPVARRFLLNHLNLMAEAALGGDNPVMLAELAERVAAQDHRQLEVQWLACRLFTGAHHLVLRRPEGATEKGREAARRYAARAWDSWRAAAELIETPVQRYELAWLLLMCPPPELARPELALQMANEAIAEQPRDPFAYRCQAAALYRMGQWRDSELSNKHSMRLAGYGTDSAQCLFLAMAMWKAGAREEARQGRRKAADFASHYGGSAWELQLLSEEADRVLSGEQPEPSDRPPSPVLENSPRTTTSSLIDRNHAPTRSGP